MEQVEQAVVRPVEGVDAERAVRRRQAKRHRDEEAPFERADLGDVPRDAELALAADAHAPQIVAAKREDMPRTVS